MACRLVVGGEGLNVGPQAYRLLEIAEQGHLAQHADDGRTVRQRLLERIEPIIAGGPLPAEVQVRVTADGDECWLEQGGQKDGQYADGQETPHRQACAPDTQQIGGIVQADADPDRHKQESRDEKDLHVGHAVDNGKEGKRNEGQTGQSQFFGPAQQSDHSQQRQGEPGWAELLPEEAPIEARFQVAG